MAKKLNPVDGTKFVVVLDRNQANVVAQALEMYGRVAVGDMQAVIEHHQFNAGMSGDQRLLGEEALSRYREVVLGLSDHDVDFGYDHEKVSVLAALANDVRLSLRIARAQVEAPDVTIEWNPILPDVPRAEVDIEIPPDGTTEMIEGATLSQFAEAQAVYAPYVPLTIVPIPGKPLAASFMDTITFKATKFLDEIADELYGTLELSGPVSVQPIAPTENNWAAQFVALACNHFPGKDGLLAVKLHLLKTSVQSSPINDDGRAQIAKYIGVPPDILEFTADEFDANLDLIESITKLGKKEEPKTKKLVAKWCAPLTGSCYVDGTKVALAKMNDIIAAENDKKAAEILATLDSDATGAEKEQSVIAAMSKGVFSPATAKELLAESGDAPYVPPTVSPIKGAKSIAESAVDALVKASKTSDGFASADALLLEANTKVPAADQSILTKELMVTDTLCAPVAVIVEEALAKYDHHAPGLAFGLSYVFAKLGGIMIPAWKVAICEYIQVRHEWTVTPDMLSVTPKLLADWPSLANQWSADIAALHAAKPAVDGKVFSSQADLDHFKKKLATSLGVPDEMLFGYAPAPSAPPVQTTPKPKPKPSPAPEPADDTLLDDVWLAELENGTPKQPC